MMNSVQKTGETLSAFVDDEMAESEIDALLTALENPACRAEMRRYALFGCDAAPPCTAVDLSERVASCIRQEAQHSARFSTAQLGQQLRQWLGLLSLPAALVPLSGAVAATLVAVVVLGLGGTAPAPQPAQVATAPAAPTKPIAAPLTQVVAGVSAARPDPATVSPVEPAAEERELVIAAPSQDRMLERLYMQHAKYRGGYALTTPVNYARVGSTLANAPSPNDPQNDSR